jgi:hypothetical protein
MIMKKKNVLRLLAFVMAASLTLTSAPASLLSGTETVYAATAPTKMVKSDFDISTTAISVNSTTSAADYAADSGMSYLLVLKSAVDSGKYTVTASSYSWTAASDSAAVALADASQEVGSNASTVVTLAPNTKYYVYRKDGNDNISEKATITTDKVSLSTAGVLESVELEGVVWTADDPGDAFQGVTYNGDEQEPAVTKITVDYNGDGTLDKDLTASALNSFTYTYEYNTNAGTATLTIEPKENSAYDGKLVVTFTINPLVLTKDNSRVTIGDKISRKDNVYYTTFDGLQQNPAIKVEANLGTEKNPNWKTLTRDTDYEVSYTANSSDTGDDWGTYNVDKGEVTVYLTALGNYVTDSDGSGYDNDISIPNYGFVIQQAKPSAPSKPVVKSTTDSTITIDVSSENLQMTYQYAVSATNDSSRIDWDNDTIFESVARTTGALDDSSNTGVPNEKTTIELSSTYNGVDLKAQTTYYVFSRIAGDDNVVASKVSTVATAKTTGANLLSVVSWVSGGTVGKTYDFDSTARSNASSTSDDDYQTYLLATNEFTSLNKTYDGKAVDVDDIYVKLEYTKGDSTVASVGDFTVYTKNADSTKSNSDAGTIYVMVKSNNNDYSGEFIAGYFTISKKKAVGTVKIVDRPYNGSDKVSLTADFSKAGLINGDSISIGSSLTGTADDYNVGDITLLDTEEPTYLATDVSGTRYYNYIISFDLTNVTGKITKADAQLTVPETVYIESFQSVDLSALVSDNIDGESGIEYTLNLTDNNSAKYSNIITCTKAGVLAFENGKGYTDVQDAGDIIVTVKMTAKETTNFTISNTNRTKTIKIVPIKAQPHVSFGYEQEDIASNTYAAADITPWRKVNNDRSTAWDVGYTMSVPSGTRPEVIQEYVEAEANEAYTVSAVTSFVNGVPVGTTDNSTAVAADGTQLTYEYYDSKGTKLYKNQIPWQDGTYTVKVYVPAAQNVGGAYTDANIDNGVVAATLTLYIGGDSKNLPADNTATEGTGEYYIEDGKIYEFNADLVRSHFVVIDGVTYYANKNGVMVHGKTFKAADGNWHYAHEDGSVETTKGIKDTDDNGKVYCTGTSNGKLLVNGSKVVDGERYVANSKGKLVKNGFFTTAKGYKYCLKNYKAIKNKVFTYTDGYSYVANKNGTIQKGKKIVSLNGKKYYVNAGGSIAKNKVVTYNGKKYVAQKSGVIAISKKVTIGKKTYTTNSKGVITKTTTK